MWDIQNDTVDFSNRWLSMLGLEARNIAPSLESWLDRVHPKDRPAVRSAIRQPLQGLEPFLHANYRIRHANGAYRWMWCRGLCYHDDEGTPVFFAATQSDIIPIKSIDQPTELPNEYYFEEQVHDHLDAGLPFSIMVFGSKRFSTLSETLDSQVVEQLRREVAARISDELPYNAALARLHGSFFAAIIPVNDDDWHDQLKNIARSVTERFVEPVVVGKRTFWLEHVAGATEPLHGSIVQGEEAMTYAWTAYRNAQAARKSFNILDLKQRDAALEQARLKNELPQAIHGGWFVPYFQPIVCMAENKICGFETLARLEHPTHGLISPGRFIPAAERHGLMSDIGEIMLKGAPDQLNRWDETGKLRKDFFVSVNIAAAQLQDRNFASSVIDLLKQPADRRINPSRIKLEVTETAIIDNLKSAVSQLEHLRKEGVLIALDDFGTGFSSLKYFHQLPINVLKVDRSFITDIHDDPHKQALVRTVVGLSDLIEVDVVVEGIESEAEAEVVRDIGIKYGQGFLFGRPTPDPLSGD